MNPEDSFDYQTIDMDPAQQNRFVWLYMNADYMQWIDWAIGAGIEEKVIEFISSYPEYLNQRHEDDIDATPRLFERGPVYIEFIRIKRAQVIVATYL